MRVLACKTPYGVGGLGQHFSQLVEESRQDGVLKCYYARTIKPGDDDKGQIIPHSIAERLIYHTPLRLSRGWMSYLYGELFDQQVATSLTEAADQFMGFVGKSLRSFRQAQKTGFKQLELVAANSHVHNVKRLYDRAQQQLGIKDSWLNTAQIKKTLREYEMADVIYIHTEYTRQSFVDEGIDPGKLKRTYLAVNARFRPPVRRPEDGVFRVVYVGRVDGTKGIPLLLEAFSRLPIRNAELTLVGGYNTPVMRRFMQKWMGRDPRIRLAPGDPLPVLQRADVFVHPSYEDGFAYAPMEALACGVPVVVTEDTGMKEYVREGVNGYVVPTGNWQALLERIEHIARFPMAHTLFEGESCDW